MRRVFLDGAHGYEIVIDDREGSLEADPGGDSDDEVVFSDAGEASAFLHRVADDYTGRVSLRQLVLGDFAGDTLFELDDQQVTGRVAQMLVTGRALVRPVVEEHRAPHRITEIAPVVPLQPRERPPVEARPDCRLISAKVSCKHGKGPGGSGRDVPVHEFLETLMPDTLTCEAQVEAGCGEHPKWTFTPSKLLNLTSDDAEQVGASVSFVLGGYSRNAAALTKPLAAISWLWNLQNAGTPYTVHLATCHDTETFRLKGYPDRELSVPTVVPGPVKRAAEKGEELLNRIFGGNSTTLGGPAGSSFRFQISLLKGKAAVKAQFKESGHECYMAFLFEAGFKPLIGASIRAAVPLPGPVGIINRILARLRIAQLTVFVEVNGCVDLVGQIGRNAPGAIGGAIQSRMALTFGAGVELSAAAEAITVTFTASTTFSCPFGIQAVGLTLALFYGPYEYGDLTGALKIKINSSFIEYCVSKVRQMQVMSNYTKFFKSDREIEASVEVLQKSRLFGKQTTQLLPAAS